MTVGFAESSRVLIVFFSTVIADSFALPRLRRCTMGVETGSTGRPSEGATLAEDFFYWRFQQSSLRSSGW